jgi:hypothetical protein
MKTWLARLVLLITLGTPGAALALSGLFAGQGTITVSQAFSRVSCYAPCYIHLDLSGTIAKGATYNYHEIYFRTTWGDPGQGSFTYGPDIANKDKNITIGPTVAHVYPTAGTFDVVTTATYKTYSVSKTTTITVSAYDTANTYCIRRANVAGAADFDGCPHAVGARQITQSSLATIQTTYGNTAGRQVLMKCGDLFDIGDSTNTTLSTSGPVHYGMYGTCGTNKWVANFIDGVNGYWPIFSFVRGASAISVSDMKVETNGLYGGVVKPNYSTHFLLYKSEGTGTSWMVLCCGDEQTTRYFGFFENSFSEFKGFLPAAESGNFISGGHFFALVGNYLWDTDTSALSQWLLRIQYGTNVYLANSYHGKSQTTKAGFTAHSNGCYPDADRSALVEDDGQPPTAHWNIVNNVFIVNDLPDNEGANHLSFGPQSYHYCEQMTDIIVEGNLLTASPTHSNGPACINNSGSIDRGTFRNNICWNKRQGDTYLAGLSFSNANGLTWGPTWYYNNSICLTSSVSVGTDTFSWGRLANMTGSGSANPVNANYVLNGAEFKNNLVYAPANWGSSTYEDVNINSSPDPIYPEATLLALITVANNSSHTQLKSNDPGSWASSGACNDSALPEASYFEISGASYAATAGTSAAQVPLLPQFDITGAAYPLSGTRALGAIQP